MISKEKFKELIQSYLEQNARVDSLCTVFPNSFGDPIIDWGFKMFDELVSMYFNGEGVEWVSWWLYEKNGNPEIKAWDDDHDEIPMETVEDLWKYIKQYRKW